MHLVYIRPLGGGLALVGEVSPFDPGFGGGRPGGGVIPATICQRGCALVTTCRARPVIRRRVCPAEVTSTTRCRVHRGIPQSPAVTAAAGQPRRNAGAGPLGRRQVALCVDQAGLPPAASGAGLRIHRASPSRHRRAQRHRRHRRHAAAANGSA